MNISKGWLDASDKPVIKAYPSGRFYKLSTDKPLGLVWHYSCPLWMGFKMAEETSKCITRNTDGASWHIMIARDGSVFQSVSFDKGSWHVGRRGKIAGRDFDNINRATIGVELENAGRLKCVDKKYYTWPYYKSGTRNPDPKLQIDSNRAVMVQGEGFFDSFTAEQVQSAQDLVAVLEKTYKIGRDNFKYGHKDFDPDRKEDPGPIWNTTHLPKILTAVFG